MKVSWNWLTDYVTLDLPLADLGHRLTMAGLTLEGDEDVAGDICLDLEVTSNRTDWLGHLGIAREIAAVLGTEFKSPEVTFAEDGPPIDQLTSIALECEELCPHYTARLIRGVKIGSSPAWLRQRLETLGLRSVNNVVDVTNYVLLEYSQPLHAFDLDLLQGRRIIVRRGGNGEPITALDGREYQLNDQMCVIADAEHPVAVAGVMGGLASEVNERTTNILLESARFDPLTTRHTSRTLKLASESSFRFERGIDPAGVDAASRRACQLIQQVAGGQVAPGVVSVGSVAPRPEPIEFRLAQIKRILGHDVPGNTVGTILQRLGCAVGVVAEQVLRVTPPTFRLDLKREIDLIEEVARLDGYDKVPENVKLPVAVPKQDKRKQIENVIRQTLTAGGFYEAIAFSFVKEDALELFTPWTDQPALRVDHPSRRLESTLRKSILPSLLQVRRTNEFKGNRESRLFEISHVFLPSSNEQLPQEPLHLGMVSDGDLRWLKGTLENLFALLHLSSRIQIEEHTDPFWSEGATITLDGQCIGYLGLVADPIRDKLDLTSPCAAAELDIGVLIKAADLRGRYTPISNQPSIVRDLNLVVDESVNWRSLEQTVRQAAGEYLESIRFDDLYRGKQIPQGKKSVLFSMTFRTPDRALTHDEVTEYQNQVVAHVRTHLGAELRA